MCINEAQFEAAKNKVIGIKRQYQGVGTLSEKTVHAVLKNYYAPDDDMHEIPIENYVADIYTGTEIIEIQTRAFDKMRRKLDAFLPEYPVTIVYPIPHIKWLSWIDEESGEASPLRESPKKGNAYQAFKEWYKIRPYLSDPHLHLKVALIDMEEYRLLNGWSRDRKKGSQRFDRIPLQFVEEVSIDRREDYMQFVPYDLPEPFTVKEFAKAVHIDAKLAGTVLLMLTDLEIVCRIGKKGNSYLYKTKELF